MTKDLTDSKRDKMRSVYGKGADAPEDEPYVPYRPAYVAGLERRVAEQREAMERAIEALEAVEWVISYDKYNMGITVCGWCRELRYDPENGYVETEKGHAPDCPRQAALAGLRRVAGLQMR